MPTCTELGYDLVGGAYRGLAVPKSTPESIRIKLSEMIGKINSNSKFVHNMETNGFVLTDISYEKMPAFIEENKVKYQEVAKQLGLIK